MKSVAGNRSTSSLRLRKKVRQLADALPDVALKQAVDSLTWIKKTIPAKELTRQQKERRLIRAIASAKKDTREGKLIPFEQIRLKYK